MADDPLGDAARKRMEPGVRVRDWGALRTLVDAIMDIAPILNAIGAYLVGRVQKRFRSQDDGQWPRRMTPNIPALIRDFEEGRTPPARRWNDRPALVDTGRLKGSFSYKVWAVGDTRVWVGTTVPYARKHQEGSQERVEITETAKRNLRKWIGRSKMPKKTGLRWLLERDVFEFKISPRPMVKIDDQDRERILKIVNRMVRGSLRGPAIDDGG